MNYTPPSTWAEVPAAVVAALVEPFTKAADGVPVLNTLGDVMGWRAGNINAMWGGPRPVTNLLVGAALGSLGGYGLGRLGEAVLPEKYFRPGAARRRGAILGGILGAAPGVWAGYDNVRESGRLGSLFEKWPPDVKPDEAEGAAKAGAARYYMSKCADVGLFDPVIPRGQFNAAVFRDPNTPVPLQATTAGLVEAAGETRGTQLVSPWDVARVAVGAGSGLISGVIAGKALGLLAGLTPYAQEKIQDLGLWSGVLRNVVPQALGLRSLW